MKLNYTIIIWGLKQLPNSPRHAAGPTHQPYFFKCQPSTLILFGFGFFVSFQSSWSTRKKEINKYYLGKMYNNAPTDTKAKGEYRDKLF
jgi:hypothetical protein